MDRKAFRRIRQRVCQVSSRLRSTSRDSGKPLSVRLSHNTHAEPERTSTTNLTTGSQGASRTNCSQAVEACNDHRESIATGVLSGRVELSQRASQTAADELIGLGCSHEADIWSAAYEEARKKFAMKGDESIFEDKHVKELFNELNIKEKEGNLSAFEKGKKRLRESGILDKIKFALDLAAPMTVLDPTALTVVGVMNIVTAFAISFLAADKTFAQGVERMLERVSYIDECDTLGQKADREDIHKALVPVYEEVLEFYQAASKILSQNGIKRMLKIVSEDGHISDIVDEFSRRCEALQKIIQKATLEILTDLKSMLYTSEIDRWLDGDQIIKQGQIHEESKALRSDGACKVVLDDTHFTTWCGATRNCRQLVILGDLGSGKTVCMGFITDQLNRERRWQIPQPIVCYYYCRCNHTAMASSIFSALTLSLLEQLEGLKKPFFQWFKDAQSSGLVAPATDSGWLGGCLQKLLKEIERPVFFVIDGLDECDKNVQETILAVFGTILRSTTRLRIVYSARPHEKILRRLSEMTMIRIGPNAERDGFIVQKAVESQLSDLLPDVKDLILKTLCRQAQGSAIWVTMTVQLIASRKIEARGPMEEFLKTMPLPGKLTELYEKLRSSYTKDDSQNLKLANSALGLLAVAHRALSIMELAWAVALDTHSSVTTVDALEKKVDSGQIMGLICPFIARVDYSDLKKRQVCLVHQSVRQFIMQEWISRQPSLEANVLNICIRYLLLDDIAARNLFSDEQVAIEELPQDPDIFKDDTGPVEYDPHCTWESWEENMAHFDPADRGFGEFFAYAACYWVEHLGNVDGEALPNLASIERLCQAGSIRLQNWIQQNCRPGCTVTPRFEFKSELYDPLGIISLYGSEDLLLHMLKESDFDSDTFLQESSMYAADQILQWGRRCGGTWQGDRARLKILFVDDRHRTSLQTLEFFRRAVTRYNPKVHGRDWDVVFDLVDDALDKMVDERWGYELLCLAAHAGCMPIVQRLLSGGRRTTEVRAELLRGFQFNRSPEAEIAMLNILAEVCETASEFSNHDFARSSGPFTQSIREYAEKRYMNCFGL